LKYFLIKLNNKTNKIKSIYEANHNGNNIIINIFIMIIIIISSCDEVEPKTSARARFSHLVLIPICMVLVLLY